MITCKQGTEWVIKSEHGVLNPEMQLQLTEHLQDCPPCRLFAEQNNIITKASQKNDAVQKNQLSDSEKKELAKAIEIKLSEFLK